MTPNSSHLFWFLTSVIVFILGTCIVNVFGAQYRHSIRLYDRICEARRRRQKYMDELDAKQEGEVIEAETVLTPDSNSREVMVS